VVVIAVVVIAVVAVVVVVVEVVFFHQGTNEVVPVPYSSVQLPVAYGFAGFPLTPVDSAEPFPAATVVDAVELPVASGAAVTVAVVDAAVLFPAIVVVDAVELPVAGGSAATVVDAVAPPPAIVVDVAVSFRRAGQSSHVENLRG